MYKQSGGTSWKYQCKECNRFIPGKRPLCSMRTDVIWKENYIACKFFKKENIENEQLSIFDFIKKQ